MALWDVEWCGNIGGIIEIEADSADEARELVSSCMTDEAYEKSMDIDTDFADVGRVVMVEDDD